MSESHPAFLILVVATGLFTAVAAFWDIRTKRIPNKLTIPMFCGGWVYQVIVSLLFGWNHLASAGLGFLVGFGILFVLWLIGGGGGGDVKLMGALSVWLGFEMTLYVLLVSTLIVLASTVVVLVWNLAAHGARRTKKRYLATGKTPAGEKPKRETQEEKLRRRVMTYAAPVAVATWLVLIWNLPSASDHLGKAPQTIHQPERATP